MREAGEEIEGRDPHQLLRARRAPLLQHAGDDRPDGEILGTYRKSHIPDGPGYQEKYYFRPGNDGFKVWDVFGTRIGVGICWDQWYPECARVMALMGAELLLYPTAIGSEPYDADLDTSRMWRRAMQGHAVSNCMPVIAANRIGAEDGQRFYGQLHQRRMGRSGRSPSSAQRNRRAGPRSISTRAARTAPAWAFSAIAARSSTAGSPRISEAGASLSDRARVEPAPRAARHAPSGAGAALHALDDGGYRVELCRIRAIVDSARRSDRRTAAMPTRGRLCRTDAGAGTTASPACGMIERPSAANGAGSAGRRAARSRPRAVVGGLGRARRWQSPTRLPRARVRPGPGWRLRPDWRDPLTGLTLRQLTAPDPPPA
jgi:hypothetical protein